MHAVLTRARLSRLAGSTIPALVALASAACRDRPTQEECDALVRRYAALVVLESLPDASGEVVRLEQQRVGEAAKNDEGFRRCAEQVSRAQVRCAMAAATPDGVEACLVP